jgi:hypothetical protein
MGKTLTKTTVRENARQAKLADKVVRWLSKQNGKRISKSKAYLQAMVAFAFHADL